MKKLLYGLLIMFSLFFCINVKALENVSITNVKVVGKSGYVTLDDLNFSNNTINSKINFNKINDFVIFEVEFDNSGSINYKLNSIDSNLDDKYLKISSDDINKDIKVGKNTVRFRIDYYKELINVESVNIRDTVINFRFSEGDLDYNPGTGFDYNLLLLILIFLILGFATVKNYRRKALLILLLIPMLVLAADLLVVNLNISNMTIAGRMLSYKIAIENGNGEIIYVDKKYGDNLLEDLPVPEKEGYNFAGWVDDNNKDISDDTEVGRNTRVLPKFEPISYNISYDLDGGVLNVNNPTTYTSDDEITLNNPSKSGVIFAGWSSDGGETFQTKVTIYKGSTGDKYYKAYYTEAPDSDYTVVHELMDENGNYVEDSREVLTGAVGTAITPQVKKYNGFTSPNPQTIVFNGTGEVVTYRYSRNKYQFSIANLEDIDTSKTTPNGEYYYGEEIKLSAKEKEGYTIIWSDGSTERERTFKLTKNTNLMLIYEPKTDTKYKVIHKTMDIDGVNYSVLDEAEFVGETHTTVRPAVNEYEGFTSPEVQNLRIMADGKAELVYLYVRNKYNLVIEDSEYVISNLDSGSYYYDTEVVLQAKNRKGYDFVRWSNDETSEEITFNIRNDITIKPIYVKKEATFDIGTVVNRKMKIIAGNSNATFSSVDNNIEKIVFSSSLPNNFVANSNNTISSASSKNPIYIWYDSDNKELHYYTEAREVYLNSNASRMFIDLRKLNHIDGISDVNTSRTTSMEYMFRNTGYSATSWDIGDLSNWDTSNVTNMGNMFSSAGRNATSWDIGNLTNWNISSLTNMNAMFSYAGYNATSWDIGNLANWNTTSVKNMGVMFAFAGRNATTWNVGDLSNWDTSNVTNMNSMFYYNGYSATTWSVGDLSNWNVSNVTDMNLMFSYSGYSSQSWNIGNLSTWNTLKVDDMSSMFSSAGYNSIDWNSIGTLNVYASDIEGMFASCKGAKATLNIYSNPNSYNLVFFNSTNNNGAQILVNYSRDTTNIDDIIATKSGNSNIIKGELLD